MRPEKAMSVFGRKQTSRNYHQSSNDVVQWWLPADVADGVSVDKDIACICSRHAIRSRTDSQNDMVLVVSRDMDVFVISFDRSKPAARDIYAVHIERYVI